MRRLETIRRCLLRIASGAFAGGLAVFLAANLYLASGSGLRRVADRMERVLGAEVTVGAARLSPRGTLTLEEIVIGSGGAGAGSGAEIATLRMRFHSLPLMRGEARLREVVSAGVRLGLVGHSPAMAGPGPNPAPVPLGNGNPEPGRQRDSPRSEGEMPARKLPKVRHRLEAFRLSGAEIVLFEGGGSTGKLRIIGIGGAGKRGSDQVMRGTVSFGECHGPASLVAKEGTAGLAIQTGTLTLTEGSAECAGGKLRGEMMLHAGISGVPFRCAVSADGLQAARILPAVPALPGRFSEGELAGALMAEGWLRAPSQTRLRLAGHLEGGVLALDAGHGLREALGADRHGRLPVERAELAARYGGGVGLLDLATFEAGPLLLKANGYAARSGEILLSLRPYLGRGRGEGPSIAASGLPPFSRLAGTDWFYRDFLVTGTLASPRIGSAGGGEVVPAGKFLDGLRVDSGGARPPAEGALRPVWEGGER